MSDWEARPLGAVCTITPPKAEARVNLIGVKYLQPHRTRRLCEVSGSYTYFADGDVLLAKITPCFENGELGLARGLTSGAGFRASEYIVLRPAQTLNAEFLYYYLARPTFLEEGARTMTGAVGHKRVTKEFIASYRIPVPPLREQRRIVAILDEAFDAIAVAKTIVEKSIKNASELFESRMQTLFGQEGAWERVLPAALLERGWITSHLDGNQGSDYPRKEEFVDAHRSHADRDAQAGQGQRGRSR